MQRGKQNHETIKRTLDFSNALVYNLFRKRIGYDSDLPSVLKCYKNSIHTLGGRDAISFYYYDRLCKTEPQKLLTLKLKLQAYS